jgi:anti-sigma factor RsiW
MVTDDCSSFAIHDLAALSDGNLSPEGIARLAGHLRRCETCMRTLAAIIEDAPSARGTNDVTEAAMLARTIYAEARRTEPKP